MTYLRRFRAAHHRHASLTRAGVGEIRICVTRYADQPLHFRADGTDVWLPIDEADLDSLIHARTADTALAALGVPS